jgi:hypothetical protein
VSRSRTALAAAAAALALTSTPAVAAPANEANDFPFPGADTIALHDGSGHYVTYGASAHGRKVPFAVHGSGTVVGSSPTIAGDAMRGGAGAWTAPGSGIWTPGAYYAKRGGVGRYYLFFTATKRNSGGRKCVGVASSTNPFRGFVSQAEPLACPTNGTRWALDADVTRRPKGAIWMTWRDGQRAVGAESALSAMRLKFGRNGGARRASKPHVLLRSNALTWAHYRDGGVTVIENPSAFYNAGSWYLFYSGNNWPTNYYATGIAYCGARLGGGLCRPMPGPQTAYFSYSGPRAHLPASMRRYGLPGNKRGPGAMDVYRARGGQPWVTWNYLSNAGGRKSRTGRLIVTGTGAAADFKVRR